MLQHLQINKSFDVSTPLIQMAVGSVAYFNTPTIQEDPIRLLVATAVGLATGYAFELGRMNGVLATEKDSNLVVEDHSVDHEAKKVTLKLAPRVSWQEKMKSDLFNIGLRAMAAAAIGYTGMHYIATRVAENYEANHVAIAQVEPTPTLSAPAPQLYSSVLVPAK